MLLKDYLEIHFKLPNEILNNLDDWFENITYEKGEYLVKKGKICDSIIFIKSGVLREFSEQVIDEDKTETVTHWLLTENEWITQVQSFERLEPALSNIQTVEKAQVCEIKKETLDSLLNKHHEVALVVLKIYQQYLLQLENRNRLHQLRKVEDRLAMFQKLQPNLANNVSQHLIASFLNTTPSNLSKVRTKLLRKK